MKILVTGGAGFIASHLVDNLIAKGHDVIIIDNLSTGREENINSKARFYKVDICNASAMADIFDKERPDVVNHHAAHADVRKSVEMPAYDANINILGSLNICQLSMKYQVKKFIYASTGGAVYGEPKRMPVTEESPIEPLSQYGVSKHTVEHYLSVFDKLYHMNFTILRYPNVYGPRQSPYGEAGVVAIFSEHILNNKRPTIFGDGSKTRDYVFVADIIEANLKALEKEGNGQIFNLGWGLEISDLAVFQAIRDALNSKIEPIFGNKRNGEIERICLDSTKAMKMLHWTPKINFEEGIKLSTHYYRQLKNA